MNDLPKQAAAIIAQRAPNFTPKLALILGSGLGGVADAITDAINIPYEDLPGFPQSKVKGHAGCLVLGYFHGVPVACLQGRAHYYENKSHQEVKTYVRALKLIGCEILFATNAAGSFHSHIGPGRLVMINDHINLLGSNPLVGPNDDAYGPRFPAMDQAYDPALRTMLREQAAKLEIDLPEGVYICVSGPNYETAAEIHAFRMLGADVVGMSTVPEIIVARHCGLRCMVISIITNFATGLNDVVHDHDEVLTAAENACSDLQRLLTNFVTNLA